MLVNMNTLHTRTLTYIYIIHMLYKIKLNLYTSDIGRSNERIRFEKKQRTKSSDARKCQIFFIKLCVLCEKHVCVCVCVCMRMSYSTKHSYGTCLRPRTHAYRINEFKRKQEKKK